MSVRAAGATLSAAPFAPRRSRLHQVLAVGAQSASAGEPRLRAPPAGGCPKCPPCDTDADRRLILAEDAYDAIFDQIEEANARYEAKMKRGRLGHTYAEKMAIDHEREATFKELRPKLDAAEREVDLAGALVKAVSPPGRYDAIKDARKRLRAAIDDLKKAEEELARHLKLRYLRPDKTKRLTQAVEIAQREVHAAEAERRKYL